MDRTRGTKCLRGQFYPKNTGLEMAAADIRVDLERAEISNVREVPFNSNQTLPESLRRTWERMGDNVAMVSQTSIDLRPHRSTKLPSGQSTLSLQCHCCLEGQGHSSRVNTAEFEL